jgi:hypothetical protein
MMRYLNTIKEDSKPGKAQLEVLHWRYVVNCTALL